MSYYTMADDVHSFIIQIPKPRNLTKKASSMVAVANVSRHQVPSKVIRKPSEISLKRFSLPGDKPLKLKSIKKEDFIIPYRYFSRKQHADRLKQRLSINIYQKYKIMSTDLRKRLHVDQPPNDVKTVMDIDECFFKFVDGRLLPHHIPYFKSLYDLFNEQLRIRQVIGYTNDCILNIDSDHRREVKEFEKGIRKCGEQAKIFNKFVFDDYYKSMKFLEECDELQVEVSKKISELENLASQTFTIMSRLIILDYNYSLQQKYGRFLYFLSPPSWRARNRNFALSVEIEARGFDYSSSNDDDTFNMIFDKLKRMCAGNLVQPVLYFKKPGDLMEVFGSLEKQQLHHFAHVTHFAPIVSEITEGIKTLRNLNRRDSHMLSNVIKHFQNEVESDADRGDQLKTKFFNVLNGLFYESVGAPDVLKLRVHLEFCFEKIYSDRPINFDIVTMAKGLEDFYMDYSNKFDLLHNSVVKRAVQLSQEEEKYKMRRARTAVRELRLFNRLEKEILGSYYNKGKDEKSRNESVTTARVDKKTKPIEQRKQKKNKSVPNIKLKRSLTEAEKEYLSMFTNWTENDDPADYLQSYELEDDKSDGKETVKKN